MPTFKILNKYSTTQYLHTTTQHLKSQINTQQYNIQNLKKLNNTTFKVSNKYKINLLTHGQYNTHTNHNIFGQKESKE